MRSLRYAHLAPRHLRAEMDRTAAGTTAAPVDAVLAAAGAARRSVGHSG